MMRSGIRTLSWAWWGLVVLALGVLSACSDSDEESPEVAESTPTAIVAVQPLPTPTPSPVPAPTLTPTPTPGPTNVAFSARPTATPEPAATPTPTAVPTQTPEQVVAHLQAAVVELQTGSASVRGLIFNRQGYVLTANHLVPSSASVTVVHADGREELGLVVGRDETRDLAVIQIEGSLDLPAIRLGADTAPDVGEPLLAMGLFGAPEGEIEVSDIEIASVIAFEDFFGLELSAALSSGNAGVLVNRQAEVVGIVPRSIPADLAGGEPAPPASAIAMDQSMLDVIAQLQAGLLILNPVQAGLGLSQDTPAPPQTPIIVRGTTVIGKPTTYEITVLEVVRGQPALDLMNSVYPFVWDPDPGHEYMLVRVRMHYVKGPGDGTNFVHQLHFNALSRHGVVYITPSRFFPMQPFLVQALYPGSTFEGWTTWQVPIDDPAPLFAYGLDWPERGRAWFLMVDTDQ